MKKKVLWLITAFFCLFGFALQTEAAAPKTLKAGRAQSITQYVDGYQAWYKTTENNSHQLFCEVANLKFPTGLTIKLGGEVDKGFVYILENKPSTKDVNKNFYIQQMAVWWYHDIVHGGSNLDAKFKNYCTNNRSKDTTCASIYKLVEGAKSYKEVKGTINFSTANPKFTRSNGYYVSDKITVTSNNLSSVTGLKLNDVPSGSSIINSTVNSKGNGTFQVRIPINSVKDGLTFSVDLDAKYATKSVYDYFYSSAYQRVIYDEIYTNHKNVSKTKMLRITYDETTTTTTTKATTTKPITKNSLVISKVDQYGYALSGAGLSLYYGNCLYSSCYSNQVYSSWITTNTARQFTGLPTGYYTIVESYTPDGYQTAEKGLVYIDSNDRAYSYTVVNVREQQPTLPTSKLVRISKTDVTGTQEVAGATLIIKDINGREVISWVSESIPKYIGLAEGEYSLIEKYAPEGYKLNTNTIYFKVDRYGNVSVKDITGKYTSVEYLKVVNETNDSVNISKLDKSTNAYLTGATLVLKNEKGEIVTTWTTNNTSHNVSLGTGYYSVEETSAPEGYKLNSTVTYFRVLEDGTLMVKNNEGIYELANGIIIYNEPELEEEIITVPKTGLTSMLTYTAGGMTLLGGAYILMKNGQFSI